jgi:hypothetical protein
MITFITDLQDNETDILRGIRTEPLIIEDLEATEIAQIPAPIGGWTHRSLQSLARELEQKTRRGANAFIGASWVGGTEV